jgi:hypothetical protein
MSVFCANLGLHCYCMSQFVVLQDEKRSTFYNTSRRSLPPPPPHPVPSFSPAVHSYERRQKAGRICGGKKLPSFECCFRQQIFMFHIEKVVGKIIWRSWILLFLIIICSPNVRCGRKNNPDKVRVHRGLACSISPVVG